MNKILNTNQIRRKWLDFFKKHNHLEVESKSLIPINDNSLLWINSGVATLKKFFSGQENPPSNRLVNSQRCIRTNDIENVGLTSRHHTFFEMLGNFSIGDYFREQAIKLAAKFIFEELNISKELIYITVYEKDDESFKLWIENGVLEKNIVKCGKDRNFWEIGTGPCGPCTEIYYDRGKKFDPDNIGEKLFFDDIENDRYIEIWNIVFSEFENDGNNNYTKLTRQNIDTGAGLERLACILQNANTNYDTDGFVVPRKVLENFSTYKYDDNLYFERNKKEIDVFVNKSFIVILDHFKACLFAISDGALPSNKDRGYILRKLLRRAFFHMDFLGIEKKAIVETINKLIEINVEYYPFLNENNKLVIDVLNKEYDSYKISIKNSIKYLQEFLSSNSLNEQNLFRLVDTYGFPIEIINELKQSSDIELKKKMFDAILENKISIDVEKLDFDFSKFDSHFDEHKKISKVNKNINGIDKQNDALMNLDVESFFDYEKEIIEDAKILKLFDDNFNEVDKLESDSGYVILDKTCIYATSGGQLHDTGYINEYIVDNAIKSPNGINVHHVVKASLKLGENCFVKHDIERRQLSRINHSSEHLLHSALKKEISNSIKQEGALKSFAKLTFDYFYPKKLSFKQIQQLEENIRNIINLKINSKTFLCTLQDAQKMGALAYFEDVYKKIKGDLRVVRLSDDSTEICGGTHVKNTEEIYDFQITSLTSKGSGSWRIEAIGGYKNITNFRNTVYLDAVNTFNEYKNELTKISDIDDDIKQILSSNINNIHYLELRHILDTLKIQINILKSKKNKDDLQQKALELKNKLYSNRDELFDNVIFLSNIDRKILSTSLIDLVNELQNKIFIVINEINGSYQYLLACSEILSKNKNINFNILAKQINFAFEGKGGGRNNFVQGSIKNINKISFNEIISEFINNVK